MKKLLLSLPMNDEYVITTSNQLESDVYQTPSSAVDFFALRNHVV